MDMPYLCLFDLDNTLIDRVDAVRRWGIDFCTEHGIEPGAGLAWITDADNDGSTPRATFLDLLRQRFGLSVPLDQLVDQQRAAMPTYVRLFPDVIDALSLLRESGWKIGIVTNGGEVQNTKIETTGLDRLVDGWAVSGPEDTRKPGARLFDIAAQRCGFTAAERGRGWKATAWMVGDSGEADIGGAKACGIDSIWLHRLSEWEITEFHPTRVAMSVSDAVTMILEPELHLPATINY